MNELLTAAIAVALFLGGWKVKAWEMEKQNRDRFQSEARQLLARFLHTFALGRKQQTYAWGQAVAEGYLDHAPTLKQNLEVTPDMLLGDMFEVPPQSPSAELQERWNKLWATLDELEMLGTEIRLLASQRLVDTADALRGLGERLGRELILDKDGGIHEWRKEAAAAVSAFETAARSELRRPQLSAQSERT